MPVAVASSALSQYGSWHGWAPARGPVVFVSTALLWGWSAASAASLPASPLKSANQPGYARIAVFGSDDRKPLPPEMQQLSDKIGTLSIAKAGAICSAFCVGPDVIATASHCLFGTAASAKPDQTRIRFTVGHGDDAEVSALTSAAPSSTEPQILSGTQNLAVTPPIAAANDWAIARLERPVCRAGGLALSQKSRTDVEAIANAGGVYEVAMHRDLPTIALMLGRPCALPRQFPAAGIETIARDFLSPEAVIFHTCDTGGGSSGSPLLIDGTSGPEVIGINVGTYVLSRMVPRGSGQPETEKSEAIANTAVETARFAPAVRELSLRGGPVVRHNARLRR